MQVGLDGVVGTCTGLTDCYRVWISTLTPYRPACAGRNLTPPQPCRGTYRIRSTGISEDRAARALVVDVQAVAVLLPAGRVLRGLQRQRQRRHPSAEPVQPRLHDQPPAGQRGRQRHLLRLGLGDRQARDRRLLRPAFRCARDRGGEHEQHQLQLGGGGGGPIHSAGAPCKAAFRFDQSGQGARAHPGRRLLRQLRRAVDGTRLPDDVAVRPRPSSCSATATGRAGCRDAQYDALRSQAVSTGTYNIADGERQRPPDRAQRLRASSRPVLYWDNGDVDARPGRLPGAPSPAA